MKKHIMEKWVAALRSGEFKQTRGTLEDSKGNCCLGILCNLALVEGVCDYYPENSIRVARFDGSCDILPFSVMKWAGMKSEDGCFGNKETGVAYLTEINDDGASFDKIADIIEKNWRKL